MTQAPLSLWEKFWMIAAIFLGTSSFVLFGADADSLDATLIYRKLLWAIVYVAFIGMGLLCMGLPAYIARYGKVIIALTALTTLSVLWSEAPDITLSSSLALWLTTYIGFYMAYRAPPAQLIRLMAVAFGVLVVGSLLVIIFLPSYGLMTGIHEGAWRGLSTHKNQLARYMVIAFAVLFYCARETRFLLRSFFYALAGLSLILLAGSQSATGYILLLVFLAVSAIYHFNTRFGGLARTALLCLTLALTTGLLITFADPSNLEQLLQLMGRDMTLTNRTEIWQAAFKAIGNSPWLGYGYDGFWGSRLGTAIALHYLNWDVPHVHNGFIETWLAVGIPGVALLLWLLTGVLRRAINAPTDPALRTLLALTLTTAIVLNTVEVNFLRYNNLFWILTLYVILQLKAEPRTA